MKIEDIKGFCRCDNCDKIAIKSINLEFVKISLCDNCTKALSETLNNR